MTPYLKGLYLTIDVWREERDKDYYKIKSQLLVHIKVWESEHKNWIEERDMEVLRMKKDETAPEWLDPAPRLREDVMELKSLTAPEKPSVTRCWELESMTDFYLLWDSNGQGIGLGLWDHEGLIYDSVKWSTQWENETSNWKKETNMTVRIKELCKEHKLDNRELFILTYIQ